MSAGVGTKSNARSQAYCTGRFLLTPDDFERLRANPEDSGRLRTTPELVVQILPESWVSFKEHITNSWLRRNDLWLGIDIVLETDASIK